MGNFVRNFPVLISAFVAASLLISSAASAAPAPEYVARISGEDRSELLENFEKKGISKEIQNSLLEKISSGDLVDADIPGSIPVSEKT